GNLHGRLVAVVLVIASLAAGWLPPAAGAVAQRRFASVEDAARALVDALQSGDQKALVSILGEQGRGLIASGDPVADRNARERFVAAYNDKHGFEYGGGEVVPVGGHDRLPPPAPPRPPPPSLR